MRIISPGIAQRDQPQIESDAERRLRLGRAAGAAIAAGWALTVLSAQMLHSLANGNATVIAGIGVVAGAAWATRRWDEAPQRSLQAIVAVGTLQVTAAALAFDRGVIASLGFVAIVALMAGHLAESREGAAAHGGLLTAGLLFAALAGPDRAPHAVAAAALTSAAALLVIAMTRHFQEVAQGRETAYRALAQRDPLTGVGTYRRLHDRLAESVATDPGRFALLTMDVDRVREVNNRLGPVEGDRLLREVGRALVDNVRGKDVVARQGNDEFSVLAPDTDEQGAVMLAQRIERALGEIQLSEIGSLNASIGIAIFPADGRTPTELLASADEALRRTKASREGRRLRAVTADEVTTPV